MMKIALSMRRWSAFATMSISTFIVVLGGVANAANWSANVKVASIEVSNINTEGIWVSFTPNPFPNHNCSQKNGQYRLGGGVNTINPLVPTATAALVNSRNVTAYWLGCDSGGTTGYPVLLGITIK
jgi:hypothetical protein